MKRTLLRIGIGLLIAAAIYLAISYVVVPLLIHVTSKPTRIRNYSADRQARLEEEMSLTIPASAEFVDGIRYSGRDPASIYILEVELSAMEPSETVDQFIRRVFSIDSADYGSTGKSYKESWWYNTIAEDFGYEFDWHICEIGDVDEIYYSVINENTLRVAIVDDST